MGSERADTIANAILYTLVFNGVTSALLCRWLAGKKGLAKKFWFFLGVVLGPLALIVAWMMPVKGRQTAGGNSKGSTDL